MAGAQRLPRPLRAAVVGVTGAGKTCLAAALARRFEASHVELDALYWGPNWTPRPKAAFRALTAEALCGEAWVVDGNYSLVRDLVWPQAQVLVWLDYALPVILWRLTGRIWRRSVSHEVLWNGNRERLWPHFFTRDSLYWWALKTYGRRRREYTQLLQQPEYQHLRVVRLKSPPAAQQWQAGL